eukprot:767958-Hanusia_phi.AAC.8
MASMCMQRARNLLFINGQAYLIHLLYAGREQEAFHSGIWFPAVAADQQILQFNIIQLLHHLVLICLVVPSILDVDFPAQKADSGANKYHHHHAGRNNQPLIANKLAESPKVRTSTWKVPVHLPLRGVSLKGPLQRRVYDIRTLHPGRGQAPQCIAMVLVNAASVVISAGHDENCLSHVSLSRMTSCSYCPSCFSCSSYCSRLLDFLPFTLPQLPPDIEGVRGTR